MAVGRSNGSRCYSTALLQRVALLILLTNSLLDTCNWLFHPEPALGSQGDLQARFRPLQGFRVTGVAAAPVSAPNVFSCTGSCCPPKQSPKLWSPQLQSGPVRTRLSFQTAFSDPAYVSKYKLAYQKLRELQASNASDPRGWLQQANVHCAYCSNTYGMDIHRTWLFFPWHRWYLYFHERILGQLIGDPTFTLPFWNWDSAAGRAIPAAFLDKSSPIYNANRNNLNSLMSQITSSCSIPQMQSAMLDAQTTSLFLGKPPGTGSAGGSVELGVHGAVHVATGLQSSPYIDMGSLSSAGKDALFYAHHLNIDRLWWLWPQLPPAANGNPRANPTSADWLNSQFAFYDENAQLTM
ncbi:hypothetical protein KFL_006970040 [Klebsormidium nitens]|uniref:Tyrosinase copper-binding domain-containing protein n=1 Tax=Klebsormidium nitens TaxID=105231 RepID=A0A1Y1IJ30_KLENI|nr:hypothetical protein KFL_006970040 [Klebsormidium nitens]|eukprot:GAQ90885.1 hypothetical protein KFL_006970040 [Klebsormidium nitens]